MNKSEFLNYIRPILESWDVKLKLINRENLKDNTGGFFDSDNMELAVAFKNKGSFELLIHEYAHFTQFAEKPSFWSTKSIGHANFFNWLESNRPVSKQVISWRNDVIAIEHDCEVRSLKLIKELKLEVNKAVYAQKANSYLLSHQLLCTYHKWPTKGCMYADNISQLMPTRLLPLYKVKDENYMSDEVIKKMRRLFL